MNKPLLLALLLAPALCAGAIELNTFDPEQRLADEEHLLVTGPIRCTAGEVLELQVRVSQRQNTPLAQGRARLICTGAQQPFAVRAELRGYGDFRPGAITACALATTRSGGRITDTHQWCRDVTLR